MSNNGDRPTPPDPHRPPPPRTKLTSAPRLVVREEVVAGAVRLPGANPPPAPKRAPPLRPTLPGSPAPPSSPPPEESRPGWREETTGRGVPHPPGHHPPRPSNPPPADLARRASEAELERELARERALRQDAEERAVEAEDAQLELQRVSRVIVERGSSPPEKPRSIVWRALGTILGAAAVVVAGWLGLDAKTQQEPKVEAAKAALTALTERVAALEEARQKTKDWQTAERKHADCIERQLRDALERVGGHTLTTAQRGGTDWAEQSAPPTLQRVPWTRAPWFTTESCPPAPP